MLINDSLDNNRIIDYDISFDNESKKTVLEILFLMLRFHF